MESLIGLAVLVIIVIVIIVIDLVSGSPQDDESKSQEKEFADAVIFVITEPEMIGGAINSVPWEAGANLAGEIVGTVLEIIVGLLIW